jgi:hypothetical protein
MIHPSSMVDSGWANYWDGQIRLIVSKFLLLSKLEQSSDGVTVFLGKDCHSFGSC